MSALFINAAILIVAAGVFHGTGYDQIADIGDAYKTLTPLLGTAAASVLFAVALLLSGQNSTLTGTLAGQIVMEGFLSIRLRPWLRRLVTRLIAIIPAIVVLVIYGDAGTGPLLLLSQVILSPAAALRRVPAHHVHRGSGEDGQVRGALLDARHRVADRVLHRRAQRLDALADDDRRHIGPAMYTHILVPVEHSDADQTILAHVRDLAHMTSARLLLVHVADGWAARNYEQLELRESEEMQEDRAYLERLADDVRAKGLTVDCKLAMGDPASEILRVAAEEHVDRHRDGHARPPLPRRRPERRDCRPRPPSRQGAGPDDPARSQVGPNVSSAILPTLRPGRALRPHSRSSYVPRIDRCRSVSPPVGRPPRKIGLKTSPDAQRLG